MRFSFSAFVVHVVVLGTTNFPESIGSTQNRKTTKKNHPATAAAPPTLTPPVRYLVAQPGHECSLRAIPVTLTDSDPGNDNFINEVTGTMPENLDSLSNLSRLDLLEVDRNNQISGIIPLSPNALPGDNELFGTVPDLISKRSRYTLRATVSNETIAFAERPTRTALTVGTKDFVDVFPDLFETSNPNGALTFVSEDEGVSSSLDGPLIAILSEPKIVGTNVDGTVGY